MRHIEVSAREFLDYPASASPVNSAAMVEGATVLAIINMSTGSEAESPAIVILQYAALAGGLLALVGGLFMMMTQK